MDAESFLLSQPTLLYRKLLVEWVMSLLTITAYSRSGRGEVRGGDHMRRYELSKLRKRRKMDSANTATSETNLLKTLSNQMADAVERVEPALVLVNGRPRQPASGIVYAQNLVLTADHVLEREEDLTIQTHDKRTLAAQFVGRDLATDLAVLRVADLGLEKAPLASEAARVGQLVMAVGRSPSE